MTRLRVCTRRLLADLFFFGVLHSLLGLGLYGLLESTEGWNTVKSMPAVLQSLTLLLPALSMYYIRKKVGGLLLFLILHGGLVAIPLVLWPLMEAVRVLCALCLLAMAIYSLTVRLRGDWKIEIANLFFGIAIMAGLSILAAGLGLQGVTPLFTGWGFVLLLCYLVHAHTGRLDDSLLLAANSKRQPVKSILSFNNGILAAFLLLAGVVAWFARLFPLDRVARAAGRGMMAGLRWLFSLIPWREPEELVEVVEEAPAPGPMELPAAGAEDPSRLLEILEKLLYYLVNSAIVLGILAGLVWAGYRLYRRFYQSMDDGDVREYIGPAQRVETLRGTAKRLGKRVFPFGRSEEERIRRLYVRTVRRHIRRGAEIGAQHTPGEIEELLRPREDLEDLTALYQQARYGCHCPD